MSITSNHVLACVPYHRCQHYVRRAVTSLLAQTHQDLTVIVANDADFETPPWPALADITDRRLIRFDMMQNRGPYFATQVMLAATTSPYMLIQDADDWSITDRIDVLLNRMKQENSDYVLSAHDNFDECGLMVGGRWGTTPPRDNPRFYFKRSLTPEFRNRAAHHGLFRRSAIESLGGYYGGFKIHYDVLLTNLVLMTGRVSHIDRPLYCYTVREDSLSRGNELGFRSAERQRVKNLHAQMYRRAYGWYTMHMNGNINASQFLAAIRSMCGQYITESDRAALGFETSRLINTIRCEK